MTREDTARVMLYLATFFPGRVINEATVTGYHHELSDLDVDDVVPAARHLARTGRFFPTVAEIREIATGALEPAEAWAAAVRAQESESTEGLDRATHEALRLTWGRVSSDVDTGGSSRRAFFDAYAAARRRIGLEEARLLSQGRPMLNLLEGGTE